MTYVIDQLAALGLPIIRTSMRPHANVDWTAGVPTGIAVYWMRARGVWGTTSVGRIRVDCHAERQSLADDVANLVAGRLGTAVVSVYRNAGVSPSGLPWPRASVEVNAVGV